jgi:acetyl esterase/lipase
MMPDLAPSFKNLAPAHILTAEFDIKRDEGKYHGRLLADAGNTVTMKRYPGVPRAFAHYNHPESGLCQTTSTAIYYTLHTTKWVAHFGSVMVI